MAINPPSILYKYFPIDRRDFFDAPQLRFTPTAEFNDPFEFKPAGNPEGMHPLCINLPNQYYNPPPRIVNYSAATDKNVSVREMIKHPGEKQLYIKNEEMVGILCLTKLRENILMWSHYASYHQGFIIGFDTTHKFFHPDNQTKTTIKQLTKVEYEKQRPSTYDVNFELYRLFYKKSIDWKYEKEWRIVVPLNELAEINPYKTLFRNPAKEGLISVPVDAIKEVIVGIRAHDRVMSKATCFIAKNPKIDYYKATWDQNKYAVKLNKVNPAT